MADKYDSAFPRFVDDTSPGMTYRQWMVGQAMAGLLARNASANPQFIAQFSVRIADLTIAAEKEPIV